MSVITQFHIQNFKAFRDSTPIDITPFTLIVGPNGSGKTSILESLNIISEIKYISAIKWPQKISEKHNRKTNRNIIIETKNNNNNTKSKLEITKEELEEISQYISIYIKNKHKTNDPDYEINHNMDTNAINTITYKIKETIADNKTKTFKPKTQQDTLIKPCYDDNEIPTIQEDGYGLASVIANMMTSDPDAFLQLQEAVRNVLPSIKRIRTRRAKVEESHIEILRVDGAALERPVKRELIGSELIFDTVSGDNIPASDMSEGTMIVLALLTEILRPGGASLLLIDDLERGIHPGALQNFVAQLRALFEVRPDLQIIATTHSPYLVTEFAREEILMTTLDDEGYALCAPMTANDQWDKWKDIAVTGEFWGIIGEDWIKELRKNA